MSALYLADCNEQRLWTNVQSSLGTRQWDSANSQGDAALVRLNVHVSMRYALRMKGN